MPIWQSQPFDPEWRSALARPAQHAPPTRIAQPASAAGVVQQASPCTRRGWRRRGGGADRDRIAGGPPAFGVAGCPFATASINGHSAPAGPPAAGMVALRSSDGDSTPATAGWARCTITPSPCSVVMSRECRIRSGSAGGARARYAPAQCSYAAFPGQGQARDPLGLG